MLAGRRRVRLLVAVVLLVVGLATGAAALLVNPRRVKVVRVVVQAPPAPPTTAKTAKPPSRPPALPPASAGTNGSFHPPTQSSSLLRAGARASFARLQASLPGQVSVALTPIGGGSPVLLGVDAPAHGWSTMKVPVLAALMRAREPQGLTSTEQGWAEQAITASDNQSILNLFGDLERLKGGLAGASTYVEQLFRQSGDAETVVATASPPSGAVTTFGQTEWAPGNAVKFFQALGSGCLLSSSQSSYVLGLMQRIIPSESWGLGSGGFGVPVAFKGGWGPEPSGAYIVRQSGIIDPGSARGAAVSITANPPAGGGSFSTGTQMLTQTARWLSAELVLRTHPPATCSR